jgi:hypothetical protein
MVGHGWKTRCGVGACWRWVLFGVQSGLLLSLTLQHSYDRLQSSRIGRVRYVATDVDMMMACSRTGSNDRFPSMCELRSRVFSHENSLLLVFLVVYLTNCHVKEEMKLRSILERCQKTRGSE